MTPSRPTDGSQLYRPLRGEPAAPVLDYTQVSGVAAPASCRPRRRGSVRWRDGTRERLRFVPVHVADHVLPGVYTVMPSTPRVTLRLVGHPQGDASTSMVPIPS